MSVPLFAFVCCLVAGVALGAQGTFNYSVQSAWDGVCNAGNMGETDLVYSPCNCIIVELVLLLSLSGS